MSTQLAEFFGKIGFKISEDEKKKLKDFDDGMKGLATSFGVVAAAGAGALYLIDKMIGSATRGAAALSNFQIQTGQSAQKLQQFSFVSELADLNSDAAGAEQNLRALNSAIADLAFSGKNANLFQMLGVRDFNHGIEGVIDQLARFHAEGRINSQLFNNLLGQLGLSPSFINYLEKREEIQRKLKAAGVVPLTDEENKRLLEMGQNFKLLGMEWSNWINHLLANKDVADVLEKIIKDLGALLHYLREGADAIGEFLNKNPELKEFIKDFAALAFVGGTVLGTIVGVTKAFRLFTGALGVGRGINAVEGAVGGLTRSLGGMLVMLTAMLYVLEHYKDIKDYFDKNPDTITAKYNPFYYAGIEAVKLYYGENSPEYKKLVKKTAGMWGVQYDDGSADDAKEKERIEAYKKYKAGKPGKYSNSWGNGTSAPSGQPYAIDDPGHQNDLPRLAAGEHGSNMIEDPRPPLPDFALKPNKAYQPIEVGDSMMSGKDVMEMRRQMSMQQTNHVEVNVHNPSGDTDYQNVGEMIANKIGVQGSNMLSDAHDQLNNGGF